MAERPSQEQYSKFQAEERFFGGKNPVAFIDDVVNALEDYLCDSMDVLEKVVAQAPALTEHKKAIGEGVDKVYKHLQERAGTNFDLFEMYALKNIFSIPPGLIVEEQKTQSAEHKNVDEAALDAEIRDLQRRLQSANYMNQAMTHELAALDRDLQQSGQQFGKLKLGKDAFGADGADAFRKLASQTQELEDLSKQILRLRGAGAAGAGGGSTVSALQQDQSRAPVSTDALKATADFLA